MKEPHWRVALRGLIHRVLLEHGSLTTRELANACQVNQDAIAPRMTELVAEGRVADTGITRSSVSGKGRRLKVWRAL